ncbi:fungal hydrophobin-domain-containing protein [Chiua virens]|nr:fungal hydrophobin-domain-containing protein [Chiua virens]
MQIRCATLLPVVALAASVLAQDNSSQCDTGSIQCCNSVYSSSDSTLTEIFGILNIEPPSTSGDVGLGCDPITALGSGSGASCTQQPVCCTDNQFNGLINIGCSPININV